MNLLFDTNIILYVVRALDANNILHFLNPQNASIYASIASEAEIKSLALQNKWGSNRQIILSRLMDEITIVDITKLNVNAYIEIESYSQLQNPGFEIYPFSTPRNMGKNDLWIASLAAVLGLQLITTDSDFDHLNGVFFDVRKITHQEFLPFIK